MQVHVESAEGSQRRLRVVVPAAEFQGQVDAKLAQTAKEVKLRGFRPGKVPVREVKRRFGAEIRQEVSGQLVRATFDKALEQVPDQAVGVPKIQEVKCEDGQDLEYTALIDVLPALSVGGLEQIKVERPVSQVTDQDLERMVETLRDQRTTFEAVARASQKGDRVNVDGEARLEGKVYEPAGLNAATLALDGGIKPAALEQALLGMQAGEEKTLDIAMPEDARDGLAGKQLQFRLKVNAVSEPRRPELDDAFFKQFDIAEGGLEAFRAAVKSNMERELTAAIQRQLKKQAVDGLVAQNPFTAPPSMVEQEAKQLRERQLRQLLGPAYDQQAEKLGAEVLPWEGFKDTAEQRVKASLLIRQLAASHGLQPDDARVKQLIEAEASAYEQPQAVISHFYESEQELDGFRNLALESQVIDLILGTASVTERQRTYDEVVKQEQAAPQGQTQGQAAQQEQEQAAQQEQPQEQAPQQEPPRQQEQSQEQATP